MYTIYPSASSYIESATSIAEKIVKIDEVINALLTSALDAAGNGAISEYQINDGQSTIRQVYRSAADVEASIRAFERIKQLYINKLDGRAIVLRDKNSNLAC